MLKAGKNGGKPDVFGSRSRFSLLVLRHCNDVLRHQRYGFSVELNPLGWPLGILGGFAYYGPTLVFSYVLLFKFKENIAFYAAVPLTMVTVGMGTMNLVAGAQNFQVFVDTAALATGVRFGLLAVVGTVCLMVPLALKRTVTSPNQAASA